MLTRPRGRALVALVILALTVAFLGATPASAGERRPGRHPRPLLRFAAHGCVEVAGVRPLPKDRAQSALPRGYQAASFFTSALAQYAGRPAPRSASADGSLLMGVETCRSGSIAGRRIRKPFAFGERVIEVQPRNATPGFHFYAVEQVSSSRRLVTALRRYGLPVAYVPGVFGRRSALGGTSNGGSVVIDDVTPLSMPSPLGTVSIWHRHRGSDTLLKLDTLRPRALAGAASIRIAPGSRINRLTGQTQAAGLGAINTLDFVGTIYRHRTPRAGPGR